MSPHHENFEAGYALISCMIVNAIVYGYDGLVPEAEDIGELTRPGSSASVALYIGAFTGELSRLARDNGLDTLAYILDMARLEADEASKGSTERDRWVDSATSRRSS
jgi:hypothetical protein